MGRQKNWKVSKKLIRSEKVEKKLIQLGLQGKELVEEIMTLKEQVAKKNRVISSLKSKKDKATRAIYYWDTRGELFEFDKWQNIINITNGLISAVEEKCNRRYQNEIVIENDSVKQEHNDIPTVITDGNVLNMEAEIDGLFQPGTPAN